MHKALYRKYRPLIFDDVISQGHITSTLKNEIVTGKIAHAYLFTGSKGTGKTTCAKILAKAVNCSARKDGNPCCVCDICIGIENASILDVIEIDAASNSGVDNVRQLRDESNFTPVSAKYRVYIIDEAHMLSAGAFNALLKIMEEPPGHVIFILATTEAHKIPPTVLSRCQRFNFRRIAQVDIAEALLDIAQKEQLVLNTEAASLIASFSDGALRDALSLLDLCVSYGGDITAGIVMTATGTVARDYLFDIVESALENDPSEALSILNEISLASMDFERLCEQLILHYRNILVAKTAKKPDSLVICTQDELLRYRSQGERYSTGTLMYCLNIVQDAISRISRAANRRAEMEMTLIRLCDPSLDASPASIISRLERLESGIKTQEQCKPSGGVKRAGIEKNHSRTPAADSQNAESGMDMLNGHVVANQPVTEKETVNDLHREAVESASKDSAFSPFAHWPDILASLETGNMALYGALHGSKAYIDREIILIDSPNSMLFDLLKINEFAREALADSIFKSTGRKYDVAPYNKDVHSVKGSDPLERFVASVKKTGVDIVLK